MRRFLRSLLPSVVVRAYRAPHLAAKARPYGALLHELCPPGFIAVDVGGNSGGYTSVLREIASEVHTFEPNPLLAFQLRCAFLLDRSVHVHRVALSDREGEAVLRLPMLGEKPLDGLATIAPDNTLSDFPVREVRVRTARLDNFRLEHVGFIKIDVEGHELAVLQGALQTIARDRPALLIEAEERHKPGTLQSLWSLLIRLEYRGYFYFGGERLRIEEFDPNVHQRTDALDELGLRCVGNYASDFLFEWVREVK